MAYKAVLAEVVPREARAATEQESPIVATAQKPEQPEENQREHNGKTMEILEELGRKLRQDSNYGNLILDEPVMLGVDLFGDSAITVKFYIKTRPMPQWAVKREMLRRLKHKFDELAQVPQLGGEFRIFRIFLGWDLT